MKVEFRAKWGHKLLFCLYGLLSCLRTVCCYYAVASLCSSFYSAWGKKTKEWISAIYLIKHAPNIQPNIQQIPYDPHTWRVAQDFHKAPFLYWNSPKTLQKIKKILIGSVIRHFAASEKIPSFGD